MDCPDRSTPDLETRKEDEFEERTITEKRLSFKKQISQLKQQDAHICEHPEVRWIAATEQSKSDDILAIGIILYEMTAFCPSLSLMYQVEAITMEEFPELPELCSPELKDFIAFIFKKPSLE